MYTNAFSMQPKTLAWALLSAGIALSDSALAAGAAPPASATDLVNQWARMVVYAVTPYCQVLTNGLRVCQPIGLVGPAPDSPAAAYQPLMRVPLAPPTVQPPGAPAFAYPQQGVNPFLPAQAIPFMPWQAAPGPAPGAAAAAAAGAQTTAELPSIVQPPAPVATPAPTPLEPIASEPALPAATVPAATTPSAPATASTDTISPISSVAASNQPAAPATVDTAAALAAAEAAIAHFEFDRADLTEAGRAALDAWLARNAKVTRVVVTGHADRLGPAPYNLDLSRRRAEAARDYLVKQGVDPRLITIVAKGETLPVTHCNGRLSPTTIACLAPNRRVVIEP